MPPEQFINRIEAELLRRPLSAAEQLVLYQSLNRQSYGSMAQRSDYSLGYLKIVGSQLWNELSTALNFPVTKKNLELIFQLKESSNIQANQDISSKSNASDLSNKVSKPSPQNLTYPGGPVPLDSPFYIERQPVESRAYQELQQPGALLRLRGPSKTGKTSLMIRLLHQAQKLEYRTVLIDFQSINQSLLEDRDRFFRWICANIGNQLQSDLKVDSVWDEDLGANILCTAYLEAVALSQSNVPLLIAFNEIERVFKYPAISQDFLSLLRFWYEQAKQHRRWRALRQLLVHATEVYIPLSLDRSPFNAGLSLKLPAFTLAQVQELSLRYGLNWAAQETALEQLQPLIKLTGGHPYLIQLALYQLATFQVSLEELLFQAAQPDGFYRNHVRQQFAILNREPQLLQGLKQVIAQTESPTKSPAKSYDSVDNALSREMFYSLESAGLICLEGQSVQLSCDLYRIHFRATDLVS